MREVLTRRRVLLLLLLEAVRSREVEEVDMADKLREGRIRVAAAVPLALVRQVERALV